ncbi:hypothetical protein [Parafrankia sp. EUN1f]|uniref:hypothetical protein n=1 Tax=Parafrankia sp. EUN1f TaxID=102897 RepID=UPI0001C46CD9|nr:hypothetical protein [Parafrankia sp. EUN1f]EFC80236.1 hypothetical protein FrEUN1fDRAFT_6630 [Parafrankia sp. EUN1f]
MSRGRASALTRMSRSSGAKCGFPKDNGMPCQNPVAAPGMRCHLHRNAKIGGTRPGTTGPTGGRANDVTDPTPQPPAGRQTRQGGPADALRRTVGRYNQAQERDQQVAELRRMGLDPAPVRGRGGVANLRRALERDQRQQQRATRGGDAAEPTPQPPARVSDTSRRKDADELAQQYARTVRAEEYAAQLERQPDADPHELANARANAADHHASRDRMEASIAESNAHPDDRAAWDELAAQIRTGDYAAENNITADTNLGGRHTRAAYERSQAKRAAARAGAEKSTPTPTPAPGGALTLDAVKATGDPDAAAALLATMKAGELREWAKANGLTAGRGTKAEMAGSLARQALAAQIRTRAMTEAGDGDLGYNADHARAQRERALRQGTELGAGPARPEPPTPPKPARARTARGTRPMPTMDELHAASNRQAAEEMLGDVKVADLRAFAKEHNISLPAGNKARMVEGLVNVTLGPRFRRDAMHEVGDGDLGFDRDAERKQRARLAGRGTATPEPKPTRHERDVSDPTPPRPTPVVGPGTDNHADTPAPTADEIRAFRQAEKTVAGYLKRKSANPAVSARPATLTRARELGLIDDAGQLTPRGRAFAAETPRKTPTRNAAPSATRRDGRQTSGGNQVTRPTPQKPVRVDPAPPAGDTPTGALPARQPQTRPSGTPTLTAADLRRISDRAGMVETPDGPGRVFGTPDAGWVTVGIYQRGGNTRDFLVEQYKLSDLWEASDHIDGQADMFADLAVNEKTAGSRQRAQDRAIAANLPILARQKKAKEPSDAAKREYRENRARLAREIANAEDLTPEQSATIDAAGGRDAYINQRAHEIVAKKYKIDTGSNTRFDGGPLAAKRKEKAAQEAAAAEKRAARAKDAGARLDGARTAPEMREALRGVSDADLRELAKAKMLRVGPREDLAAALISHREGMVRHEAQMRAQARVKAGIDAATDRAGIEKALGELSEWELKDFVWRKNIRVPGRDGLPEKNPTRRQIVDTITRDTLPADHPDLHVMPAVPGSREDADRRYAAFGPNARADVDRITSMLATPAEGRRDSTVIALADSDPARLRVAAGRMENPRITGWDTMRHGELVAEMASRQQGARWSGKAESAAYQEAASPAVISATRELAQGGAKARRTLNGMSTAQVRAVGMRRGVPAWSAMSKADLIGRLIADARS